MKKLLIYTLLTVLMSFANSNEGIYQFGLTDTNGSQHQLSEYQGKKIWIVLLPPTADSLLLGSIDSLSLANDNTCQTIAIAASDNGFSDSLNSYISLCRERLDSSILICKSIYTRKSSGSLQTPLFTWLTNADQNQHFDREGGADANMYFVSETGDLYGILDDKQKENLEIIGEIIRQ